MLNFLRQKKLEFLIVYEDFDLLLAKFILIVANMINVSMNHPYINKALFECCEVIKSVIQYFEKKKISLCLLNSLCSFFDVSLWFYNKNFVEIFPEILEHYRIQALYFNSVLDDKQLNNETRNYILKVLVKFKLQSDKFKENYFGNSDIDFLSLNNKK